jgi:hypothetical protein
MDTGVADRFDFLEQLRALTGGGYVASALVLCRPRWGLGAVATPSLLAEVAWPSFSSLDHLDAHMLCLNEAGTVEDWVLISSPMRGTTPSSPEHLVGECSLDSLALGHRGLMTARATWGAMRGRVPRRLMGDFERLASSGPATER